MVITIETMAEAKVVRWILDRALNCLEPEKWPPMAIKLDAAVNEILEVKGAPAEIIHNEP